MRVSFGPTSSLGPSVKTDSNMSYEGGESNTGMENGNVEQDEKDMIRQLKKERDECLKREEALKDRIKLQETLNNKQIQDLRSQVKKLTIESQKVQKSRDSISGPGGARSERKREGRTKEVRELVKTVDSLKAENETLRERLNKLSEFVKVAGDLKTRAVNQCASKNELILSLQGELQVIECLYNEETQRRVQAEGEISSLRTYINYIGHKNRDKMRNKSSQTDTSIPPKFLLSGKGTASGVDFTASSTASFANLSAAAANWRLKQTEASFRADTKQMKKKFDDATESKRNISTGKTNPESSSWRQRSRRNRSVQRDPHSAKDLTRSKESSSHSSETEQSVRRKSVRSPHDKAATRRQDAQAGGKDARDSKSDRSSESPRPYRSSYFGKMDTAQPIPPPPTKAVPGHTTHPHRAHKAYQHAPVMAMAEIIYNARSTNELEPVS